MIKRITDWCIWHPEYSAALLMAGSLALIVALFVTSAYFEASAYERVTGKHVSTWDAMFLELRVQEGPDGQGSN